MPQVTHIETVSNNNGIITRKRVEFITPDYIFTRFVDNILQETRNATQDEADELVNLNEVDDYKERWSTMEALVPSVKLWITDAEKTSSSWDKMTLPEKLEANKLLIDRFAQTLKGLLLLMSQVRNKIF